VDSTDRAVDAPLIEPPNSTSSPSSTATSGCVGSNSYYQTTVILLNNFTDDEFATALQAGIIHPVATRRALAVASCNGLAPPIAMPMS
jgi:hypothetical protein